MLIELAQALGGSMAAALPWTGFVEALWEQARGLYQAGSGMPAGETAETFEPFWAELQSRGVWYDQPYEFGQWERAFATPSGKFEFASQILQERLETLGTVFADEDLLPRYQAPAFAGEEAEYPFHLHTFKPITYTERWGAACGPAPRPRWSASRWGKGTRPADDGQRTGVPTPANSSLR